MTCLKLVDKRCTNVAVSGERSTSMSEKSAYTRILAPGIKYMTASVAHDDRFIPKIWKTGGASYYYYIMKVYIVLRETGREEGCDRIVAIFGNELKAPDAIEEDESCYYREYMKSTNNEQLARE